MLLSLKQQEDGSLVAEHFLTKYGQDNEAETGQPPEQVVVSLVKILKQKPGSHGSILLPEEVVLSMVKMMNDNQAAPEQMDHGNEVLNTIHGYLVVRSRFLLGAIRACDPHSHVA